MKTPIFNIHDIVVFTTFLQCLFLAMFQAFAPGKNSRSKSFLAVFFIDMALASLCVLVLWNQYIQAPVFLKEYIIPYLLVASILLKGPLLYAYVLSLTITSFQLQYRHLIHLTPLIICSLVMIVFQIGSDDLTGVSTDSNALTRRVSRWVWYCIKWIAPIYGVLAVYKVHCYRFYLKQQYSSFSALGWSWMYLLSLGFTLNWIWSIVSHIVGGYLQGHYADTLGIIDNYITLALVLAAFINGMAYADKMLTAKFEEVRPKHKEVDGKLVQRIVSAMEVDKLYLDARLNIESFAEKVGIPYRDVSMVINRELKTNFFEYVNGYRIEEAKKMLADPSKAHMTILDILLEAGFNSRSAFHRFWKRLVDVSPTEYRQRQEKS